MTNYQIVVGTTVPDIEAKVDSLINMGYKPHGSLVVVRLESNPPNPLKVSYIYHQAVLKSK